MNEDKWKVIKYKFEQTLKSWEIDKKCNQFTVDSICSLFPTELEAIIDYIKDLQQENQSLKDSRENAIEYINNHTIEWVDEKFKENNIMVKFDEYSNPQALLEILKRDK